MKGESITYANTDSQKFNDAKHEEISLSNVIYPEKGTSTYLKIGLMLLSV
jgi:hypothetical protein